MAKQASKYAIAWTASLGMFMAVLDGAIVNVALIPISRSLKVDLNDIEWIITSYLLALAAVIPVAGYLGQRFGAKRVFIISQLIFVAGSVACAFAPDLTWLVIFRVIQALGGGALFPLAQVIAVRAFAPHERANVSAILGVSALVAPVLGPTLGGILTDSLGWQAIFFVNLPVGLAASFLAWRIVPKDEPVTATAGRKFDWAGLILSVLGVLAVIYALSIVTQVQPGTVTPANPRGDIYGWGYGPVWLLMAVGLVLLAAFAVYELRFSADPVLDLRLFKSYGFTAATLACCLVAMTVFGAIFLLPVFLQQIRTPHLTATETGLLLLPQGIASTVAVFLSGRVLYNRLGVRWLVALGALLLIIGTLGLTNLQPDQDEASLIPWLIIRGLGFGWTFVPTQTRALQELTGLALAKGSSLLNVLRQIFSSVGTAIVNTVFLQQITQHVQDLRQTGLNQQVLVGKAGTQAANDVFVLTAICTGLVLLFALTLRPYRPATTLAQPGQPASTEPELVAVVAD